MDPLHLKVQNPLFFFFFFFKKKAGSELMDFFWPIHRLSSDMQGEISLMDTDRTGESLIGPVRRECVSSTCGRPHVVLA